MTAKRNPEERSPRNVEQAAQTPAQPTGSETFETEQTQANAASSAEATSPAEAQSELQQLATEYYKNLSETAAHLSRQASEFYEVGSDALRQNPWTAVGAAAGVGLLIGLIIE